MLFFLGKSNIPSFIHSFIHSSIYLFTLRWLDKITGFNYNFKSKNINISKYENFVHHSLIHPGNIETPKKGVKNICSKLTIKTLERRQQVEISQVMRLVSFYTQHFKYK